MVGATANAVTVCCPECGGPLRVSFADGGSIVGCHRCGESVRVPARPHPVETPAESPSLLPPMAARQAARGVRLLQLSLALFAVEHLLLGGTFVAWLASVGPANVFSRVFGPMASWLAFAVGLDLGLLTARTLIRWVGYRRCEAAAAQVGADGWVRWARWAPVLRLVGYVGTFGPWVLGVPFAAVPVWGQVLSGLATVAWTTGAVMEFGAVPVWGRLLVAVGDRRAAGLVGWYTACVVIGGMLVLVGLSVFRMTLPPRLRLEAMPQSALPAIYGLTALAGGVVGAMTLQYARLLANLRERLRAG